MPDEELLELADESNPKRERGVALRSAILYLRIPR